MNANKNRIIPIDIARGIAIICIILGHLGQSSINRIVFTFHVPIFYFISGYFISRTKDLREFVHNKFKSLIIPYIITCVCIILLSIPLSIIKKAGVHPVLEWVYASLYAAGDSYTEPFYIKGIGAIWFLWATFWGSLFLRISLYFNRYARMVFIIILFFAGYYS
ncbi:MAG: acyltransferase family protein, partial [Lachnospiraceae bacterium]|nr:acyltransferase family protein [Lachnospiraceae bacterium]